MTYSPLRYPGGKNRLSAFLAKICIDNNIHGHYVEPYAGGASVALFLLIEGYVGKITINDKDRAIYAFWYAVKFRAEELCALIDETEVSMTNWYIQKEIQNNKETADLLSLGFSTLFLNRTNRSGIIKGGVIGGKAQAGEYKMDCRFNKDDIKMRIRRIAKYARNITVLNEDALDLIDKVQSESHDDNTIIYFDPPYYLKADQLYMNHYIDNHHQEVSNKIKGIKNIKYIVSYDDHTFIENLYKELAIKRYSFNHSAGPAKAGKEILFFSESLMQPNVENYNPIGFKMKRKINVKEIIYTY
jgi:DNA adenine methylase